MRSSKSPGALALSIFCSIAARSGLMSIPCPAPPLQMRCSSKTSILPYRSPRPVHLATPTNIQLARHRHERRRYYYILLSVTNTHRTLRKELCTSNTQGSSMPCEFAQRCVGSQMSIGVPAAIGSALSLLPSGLGQDRAG